VSGRAVLAGALAWDSGQPVTIEVTGPVCRTTDVSGLIVAPGLLDLQINGAFGNDITCDPTSIWEIAAGLPRWGVTAFLPTIISSPPDVVATAQRVLAEGPPPGWEGATPLGVHCEGPLIAPSRRGAHPESALVEPGSPVGIGLIDRWGGLDKVRMVTLAPELAGAEPVIRRLVAAGVVVAAGHSDADFDTAVASFGWGVGHGTHLFNAMSGVEHRRPGLAAALLATPAVTTGLIADGVHVHPGAVATAWQAKGPGGVVLVSDAMAAAGLGDGCYRLGGTTVTVGGGRAIDPGGRLAGSVASLAEGVRNLVRFTGCEPAEAIAAATTAPAAVLARARRSGALTDAVPADAVLFDAVLFDDELEVQMTVVGGRIVYDRTGAGP
jgi:N-acetylglucosamine-6-phosphate deacetylase